MAGSWIQRWKSFLGRVQSDADLEEELRTHSEMETEDLRARGLPDDAARRMVRLKTGDARVAIEKVRDQELLTVVEGWYRDMVLGLREVRKNPVFSLTAVLTLALGIGANVAIFSFLYGLVLRSLPTRAPSEIMEVGITSAASEDPIGNTYVSYRMLSSFRKDLTAFSEISGWDYSEAVLEDHSGSLRKYSVALVTGNAFEVITMRPYLGRLLAPFDDMRGGPPNGWPVVLGYGFWNDRFGSDAGIIGKKIRISGVQATVVGVAPPDFRGVWPGSDIELYLPLEFANQLFGEDVLYKPDSLYGCSLLGRLKPGASLAAARAEVAHLQGRYLKQFIPLKYQHVEYFEKAYLKVAPARTGFPTYVTVTYGRPLYLMQALVGVVLLLCCVNIGGLMMTKVYARQREFAMRTALGARVWRLVRQHLTESLLIAAAGSFLGALLAWRGCDVLLHFFRDPMMGEAMSVHPDRALFYAAGILAMLATLLFGMIPAWRAGHADPGELLKSRTSLGGRRRILGRTFVPIQVALSLVLVTLASLLSQSVMKLRSERTGFDIDHITIQNAPLYLLKKHGDAMLNLYQRMIDRLDEMPGIRAATAASQTPLTGVELFSRFEAAAGGSHPPQDSHMDYNEILPGYFAAMQTRIVQGREFVKNERSLNVCILNQSAAAFFFPHQQAVGQYIRATDEQKFPAGTSCRVVGLAQDAKFWNVRQAPPRTIYFPVSTQRMDRLGNLVFLINAESKRSAISGFRKAHAEIAPTVPLVIFATLREQMDAALGSQELITLLSNFFGLLALILSSLGLYGLLAASVAQRTGEIGLRVALGADRRRVVWMVVREALGLLIAGLLLGAGLLVLATNSVTNMLHGVSAFDPVTLLAVTAVLTAVTVAAALVPAFRAARVDPMVALRAE